MLTMQHLVYRAEFADQIAFVWPATNREHSVVLTNDLLMDF